jgi:type II secretory pathway component PulM
MLWLERLESGEGIVVRQITVDRRELPGQVSARLVLRN